LLAKEIGMGFGQQGAVVFRIARNEGGRWDIFENDVVKALATFDDRQDACDYANSLSITKEGSTVLMLDESSPMPAQGQGVSRH
jgi:hypothetical protein